MSQSSPPVPGKLREILKDYPGHIERLQEALNRSAERSRQVSLMPFDDAISALEGRLATFIIEARDELASAEASGDARAIADAAEKERLMLRARLQRQWIGDESIHAYFQGFEPSANITTSSRCRDQHALSGVPVTLSLSAPGFCLLGHWL